MGGDGRSAAPDDVAESLRLALETYLDHLGVERGLSANTLAAYRRDLTRYLAFLAGRGRGAPAVVPVMPAQRESEPEAVAAGGAGADSVR